MKNQILMYACSSLMFAEVAMAGNTPPKAAFPDSWYVLPEDSGMTTSAFSDNNRFSALDANPTAAKEALNHTLTVNNKVIERVAKSQAVKDAESITPWHMAFLGLDLGLSASGVAGVLYAKGEATANLYWRRLMQKIPLAPQKSTQKQIDQQTFGDAADFSVRGDMTAEQIRSAIEPVISSAMATGQVNDENALRNNLFAFAQEFVTMVNGIEVNQGLRWTPARLRFDFSIDAAGMVHPGLWVGGGLKIRFDWFPSATNFQSSLAKVRARAREASPKAQNLNETLRNLAHELQMVRVDDVSSPGKLNLNLIDFSLAIFANGKFGVAKGSINAMGMIYFRRNPNYNPAMDRNVSSWANEKIAIVEETPPESHISYAQKLGIDTMTERGQNGDISRIIYLVPHDALQQGLEKTLKMGAFLAEQSAQHQSENWALDQLRVQFALSLGGSAGLVTIGATAAMQLIYQVPANLALNASPRQY